MTGIPIKRKNVDTDTCVQKEDDVKRHMEKTADSKPRREAWKRSSNHSPLKEPTLPTPYPRLLASSTVSNKSVWLSHSVCGTLLQQLQKTNTVSFPHFPHPQNALFLPSIKSTIPDCNHDNGNKGQPRKKKHGIIKEVIKGFPEDFLTKVRPELNS